MKKIYGICALASVITFSDACWGGAFMDALKKIGENSAVELREGVFWFDKAKDSNQKKRFEDTEKRWRDNCESWDNVDVEFYPSGPCSIPYLRIGSYKILGAFDDKFGVLDMQDHPVRNASLILPDCTATYEGDGVHVIIKDNDNGFHLDFYWDNKGTVIVKDSSVRSIEIYANFVHFLGDNHFEKATIAALSGCTFWGSITTVNDLKICSYSIPKFGGFLGGEQYCSPYEKSLTESELDNFVTTCPDYTKWLSDYVYGSDVGVLNIGGRVESDEVKTEDISFNIDSSDTQIHKSLTQIGKNNKTIIRSRGNLVPIALQWLGYFIPNDNQYNVYVEKFIGTKAIKIAKKDNIGYSETIKNPENYNNKVFYCNNYISSLYRLCNKYADNKLGYTKNAFSNFKYEDGELVDDQDLQVSDYPVLVEYDGLGWRFLQQSKKKYQFWFEFNGQPIYFGSEANGRLNALLNFQIFGDYDENFGQGTDKDIAFYYTTNPASWYRDKDGQDEDDSDDDNEVVEPEVALALSDDDKNDDNKKAEPKVVPVPSSNNDNAGDSNNTTNGQLEVAPGYIMHPDFVNKINNEAGTQNQQNNANNVPPTENSMS